MKLLTSLLALSAFMCAVMRAEQLVSPAWSISAPSTPKGADAFRGPLGWHWILWRNIDAVHTEPDLVNDQVNEAIGMCQSHKWAGYVIWRSAFGIEADSCAFMKKVVAE
jgi:hypothetical protein